MSSFIDFFVDGTPEAQEGNNKGITNIALVGTIAAWLILPVYLMAWYFTGASQYQALIYNNIALAVGLLAAYFLARFRIKWIPAWLTALLIEVTFVVMNLYIAGFGIILAVIMLVIVFNIALQSLSGRQSTVMLLTGFVAAGLCIMIDLLNLAPAPLEAPIWLQQVVIVFGGIFILLLTINLIQTAQFTSAKTQLSVALLAIAIVPLVTTLATSILTQIQSLKEVDNNQLVRVSQTLANEVDVQLTVLNAQIENYATLPAITKFLNGEETDLLDTLNTLSEQNPFIMAHGVLSPQGVTLLDVRAFRIGQDNAGSEWFRETIARQAGYVSEVYYDENIVRPVFYVSAPVFNDTQEIIGVLYAQYDVEYLRNILLTHINALGTNTASMIIDRNGIILAHTAQPNLHLKTLASLDDEKLTLLQATRQLPSGTAESNSAELTGLALALTNAEAGRVFSATISSGIERETNTVATPVTKKDWRIVSSQPDAFNAFAVLAGNSSAIIISILILGTVLAASAIMSRLITVPINRLAQAAKEVGKGNLHASSEIKRSDEFGILAQVFDDITAQLRNLLQGTDERVNQRIEELGQANDFITRRAEQLKTISNATHAINNLKSLQILLPQITEEISKSFGYYHVGIFLIDPSGQYATLQASNSEGGSKMLARGYRLRVGQVGIVGYVTAVGKARVALDVGEEATFFNYPDLPQTRSEMALPLKAGSVTIGALDLQSDQAAAFSNNDIEVFSLLADQVSTAIQNSRLFDEIQAALSEAQLVFSKNVKTSWSEIVDTEKGAFQFVNGLVKEVNLLAEETQDTEGLLEMPIMIRGERLGKLNIKTQVQREWNEQELRIFQSIVDRLGFALENARLFRDAQRLVSKERVIGDISDKISRSVDLDNILQTAVQELGHIISDSEVTIQFGEEKSLESQRSNE
jgi:GAF domain-containing protein/HAMP domain-containing protein